MITERQAMNLEVGDILYYTEGKNKQLVMVKSKRLDYFTVLCIGNTESLPWFGRECGFLAFDPSALETFSLVISETIK